MSKLNGEKRMLLNIMGISTPCLNLIVAHTYDSKYNKFLIVLTELQNQFILNHMSQNKFQISFTKSFILCFIFWFWNEMKEQLSSLKKMILRVPPPIW